MAPTPTTPRAARTVERVLEGALELFNSEGVAAVTTNHVAKHVGISPGNLYYWFPDKQAIVRALFDRYAAEHGATWPAQSAAGPADLGAMLAAGAAVTERYRFLARDLLALVHADPELAAAYRAHRASRIESLRRLARAWRAAGLVRDLDDERLDDVVAALWILSESWWPFAALDVPTPTAEDGARLLRAVLEPHLRELP